MTDADRYLAAVDEAIDHFIDGNPGQARSDLRSISGELWTRMPPWPKPTATRKPSPAPVGRRTFTKTRAASTFKRDGYQCRYCGQRIIPVCILSLVASIFPTEVAFVDTYKAGSIHPMFWLIGAEADHLQPGARGGDWEDPDNHVTACVLCNARKSDWTLEELGWSLQERETHGDWFGKVPSYGSLWMAAGEPRPAYHRQWLRAFEAVEAID